jgi:hypothetical protein
LNNVAKQLKFASKELTSRTYFLIRDLLELGKTQRIKSVLSTLGLPT